ncbi:MAG: FtsH protease activity modulator HflK [Alphaproteobacteria bacterium]|jgi:membrane protease subunit HflK
MPWNNQGGGDSNGPWGQGGGRGGSGGGGGPWGQGGGGQTPPDFDKAIRQGRDALRRVMPGGGGGSAKSLILLLIIFAGIWAATGFYRVNPQQQGVVLRFGEWVRTTAPGLHYHLPYPIETVLKPEVTRDNRIEIGFRDIGGNSSTRRDIADESQMITGDENIVDIDFVVFWRIADAGQYLFNLAEPEDTIKVAAEAVMREIIGRTPIQTALTEGRQDIQVQARSQLQELLNEYGTGVRVRDVQLLAVDPPADVIDAFNEVQRARQDRDRLKNEAEAFRNDIVPRARGAAAKLIAEAEAYGAEVVNRAKGDSSRFDQVYSAYAANPDVTRERIYIETVEEIFTNVEKIIIDEDASGSGVVPYLPLKELNKQAGGN